MWRTIAGVLAGLITWAVVVTLLNFGLRAALPGYHEAEATLQFTLAMKIGRLSEAALSSLAAGAVTASIDASRAWGSWLVGIVLLASFVPVHVQLWAKFPVWYHLAFLVPLAPLIVVGARLAPQRSAFHPSRVS